MCGDCCCWADSGSSSSRSRVRPDWRTDRNWRGKKRSSKFTWKQRTNNWFRRDEEVETESHKRTNDTNKQKQKEKTNFKLKIIEKQRELFSTCVVGNRSVCVCVVSTSSCALHVHCSGSWGAELQSKPFLWRSRATSCDGFSASCQSKHINFTLLFSSCFDVKHGWLLLLLLLFIRILTHYCWFSEIKHDLFISNIFIFWWFSKCFFKGYRTNNMLNIFLLFFFCS